ncbi:unnamed protein product [Natator depressus]
MYEDKFLRGSDFSVLCWLLMDPTKSWLKVFKIIALKEHFCLNKPSNMALLAWSPSSWAVIFRSLQFFMGLTGKEGPFQSSIWSHHKNRKESAMLSKTLTVGLIVPI